METSSVSSFYARLRHSSSSTKLDQRHPKLQSTRDRDKIFFGITIILARLANHAELMVLGGGRVGDNLIQLAQFQRSGIVLVLHADDESWLWVSRSHSSSKTRTWGDKILDESAQASRL